MNDHLVFEVGVALVLIAGAATLSWKLHSSTAPFLILAGMAVGPHLPNLGILDLRFADRAPFIAFMGRLGVLFLLFYLGLEFSVGRLVRSGRSIVVGGSIYIAINFTIGLLYPALLGWPLKETLVAAGITTISSSAIVAKVLVDLRRTAHPETELILGIVMFEDVFLAVYLSVVSGLVLSGSTSPGGAAISAGVALAFMLGVLAIGRLAVPWLNRALRVGSDEVVLLVIVAALLVVAGGGEAVHVAEAIGALLVGLVLAETEHRHRIGRMIVPFRDFFGALFFFGFGLGIDPFALGGAVWITLGAVALTLLGNFAAGMLAGRAAGLSQASSANVGLTVVSRGEFSVVVASLAAAGGLMQVIQPFAALYVLILAILGPLLTRQSHAISSVIFHLAGRFRRPQADRQET